MNWGARIAILYCGFVVLIVSLVVGTFYHKSDLVAEDYYQKETVFQKQLNAEQASRSLGEQIHLQADENEIRLRFPAAINGSNISGSAHFYAAANAKADRNFPLLSIDGNNWRIERSKLAKARYEVQVSWSAAGKEYYQALPLNLLQ